MKRVVYLFPTNRTNIKRCVEKGISPDTFLYGLNHLGRDYGAKEAISSPVLEKILNFLFFPMNFFFNSQHTTFNIGRLLLTLSQLRSADIVVCCVDSINKPAALLRKLHILKIPLICMAGNVLDGTERFLFLHRWVWSGADVIVAHAPVDLEKLRTMGLDERGVMLPVGSDDLFWKSSRKNSVHNLIVSVGSDRDRDYQTLVKVAEKLPDFSFEIHTSGFHANSFNLSSNIRVITDSTPRRSRSALQCALLVVIPLRETYRAAGQLALIDALLMKKPVILSNTRGTVSAYGLKHRESIYLVRPGDQSVLCWAIETLSVSRAIREKISINGHHLAIRYTTRHYAQRLKKIINGLLGEKVSSTN